RPFVQPGQITPTNDSGRASVDRYRVIRNSSTEFDSDKALSKTTSRESYVNMQLRDAGFTKMSEDESRQLVTV
ncbi:MAG: hypothetical protein AABZ47_08440, partial [Planctomycetota bacterium]